MNKTLLIIRREYMTRVRKKSFIVMTILGPILMAALFIVPIMVSQIRTEKRIIEVVDETGLFQFKLKSTEEITYTFSNKKIEIAKDELSKSSSDGLLFIPMNTINVPNMVRLYSKKELGIDIKTNIESQMKVILRNHIYILEGLKTDKFEEVDKKAEISVTTAVIRENGNEEETYSEISMALGMFGGIVIYFLIFMFGSQIMRGVIEEKTSRIIEVIISSVKPFQLLMGKIVGVALVGLTQFLLWVIFTFAIVSIFKVALPDTFNFNTTEQISPQNSKVINVKEIQDLQNVTKIQNNETNKILSAFGRYNFLEIALAFVFFFIGGYLLYGALFAAIGAAVDSESDTQQFMLPLTAPIIFAIIMAQFIIKDPQGPLSFWLSIIPFTSPIIMMIRIPFGVPLLDMLLSMGLLILGFLFTTWLASRIYRVGILMYGKKVTYKELWKWLFYN